MILAYVTIFSSKPSTKFSSPLEKDDHPEIDMAEFLDARGTQQFQSLIGALQCWSISIGQFDIITAVMTLSSFCTMPHHGHIDHVKCMYWYLFSKMKDGIIHIHTGEPDYSSLPDQVFNWERSVYCMVILQRCSHLPMYRSHWVSMLR
jgi:hypothetical protein